MALGQADAPDAASAERSPAGVQALGRWRLDGSARVRVGYDTNVFQTDSATGDAFTNVGGAASAQLSGTRSRLRGRVELSRKFYRQFSGADEWGGSLDLNASRKLGAVAAGIAVRSAYFDLRLLDREGNLLPRSNFASLTNGASTFATWLIGRKLQLAADAGYRRRDYEETSGRTSLDYGEWWAEVRATRALPARVTARVRGTWEDRDYHALRAADSTGAVEADHPGLRLRRVQGEARVRKRWGEDGLVQATVALRRSDDLFRDELTYDQRLGGLRARVPIAGWIVGLNGVAIDRDFELRRSGGGEPLEESFLSLAAEIQRALGKRAVATGGYSLFRRSTNEVQGGYTVGTLQLGILHTF